MVRVMPHWTWGFSIRSVSVENELSGSVADTCSRAVWQPSRERSEPGGRGEERGRIGDVSEFLKHDGQLDRRGLQPAQVQVGGPELFGGQRVFDANPRVEAALKERGRLWHRETFSHQYPHCWRCHNPVIFLATSQWFIRMDAPIVQRKTLRAAALDAIDHNVKWIPSWGHDRMYNMIANRPDWCISRQRVWGVPIPAVDCAKCNEALVTPALVEKAAEVFEQYGADAWYERPIEEFIPAGLTCPSCGGATFELDGREYTAFDGGSTFKFSEGVSLMVTCKTQEEVDRYWSKLTDGGEEGLCGWLKDRYGLSWQVVPAEFLEIMNDPDESRRDRAIRAMMTMKKLDLPVLKAAADGAATTVS